LHHTNTGEFVMSDSVSIRAADHYEGACDQAIAMCDGNLRSTIKALIMVNEYLELQLQELQAMAPVVRTRLPRARGDAA
jgi:hypothetical protein